MGNIKYSENYGSLSRGFTSRIKTDEVSSKRYVNDQENLTSHLFIENRIAREPVSSLENVRWLTTNEAAQYLRVSISSLKTMIYRGQVRAHKLGRRNRFLIDELERLIKLPIYK